jgi:hypothetical protein
MPGAFPQPLSGTVHLLRFDNLPEGGLIMSALVSWSAMRDTEYLEQALLEYRESNWDDRNFRELPPDVQHAILQRAQDIKDCETRLHALR